MTSEVKVICEIASAHAGDFDRMISLLNAAHASNADWVKVQVFNFESLVAGENADSAELKQIEFETEQWEKIFSYAHTLDIGLLAEVFDTPSLDFVSDKSWISGLKIPTADLADRQFIDDVCALDKPIFIGVGGATESEIDSVFSQVTNYPDLDLVLLHGIQSFPTNLNDSLLRRISYLKSRYQCSVGFADHIDADQTELARALPVMAIGAGASVIEKHITLNRAEQGFDYYSSLNPDEFKDFVSHIRTMSQALGKVSEIQLTEAEKTYRHKMKKFAVARCDIAAGSHLKSVNFDYRRTSTPGLTRTDIAQYTECVFKNDLPKGSIILENHFE